MSENRFFKKKGSYKIKELFENIEVNDNIMVNNINNLLDAEKDEITFLDSSIYSENAKKTKASFCITNNKLKSFLPNSCTPIVVKNVLFETAKVAKKFYPDSDIDYPDIHLLPSDKFNFKDVKFGNNVCIGNNVKIGQNSTIGNNTIIEHDVVIGSNCIIGSQVNIKNSMIGENVVIQDGCNIGLKGFGFIPFKEKNFKFPHIGKVIINDDVEIASSCTIDRGSIDDTVVGKNTYIDNQVHIAHNVKIGKNCMIAGQVGFAGSSIIGDNVSIGGQAGISGHLKIGNNVKIGGGSGVVKDVEDNSIVMGYPAVPLKEFLKDKK